VLAESGVAGRRQAERLLAQVRRPSPYAGRAALERATLIRRSGRTRAGRAALRAVVRLYPGDTAAAAGALLALAEMATDGRRDADARDAYLALARGYPTSEHAPRARFNAAILAFADREHRVAAAELDSVASLYPSSVDAPAARYWSGRARAALGDSAGARARWETLPASEPLSYYAAQAARRLGVAPWAPPAAPDTFAAIPDVDEAFARADLLARLGMGPEARLEMDALAASADSAAERALTIANAFRARGQLRRAMELGRRAVARGATDARAWRLVYPLGEADLVAANAAGRRVDPALVAAVIRQESSFEPRATSAAGARGLMQVMPRVGQLLARAERIAPWDPALLYDPDVNIRLGVLHLRSFTEYYAQPALALAAYNAGPGRVARWSRRRGGGDPELFVERIRFAETRSYVRTVLRSRDMYAALYDWGIIARGD
jgi:soluble lytic murein transglycosylase